MLFSGKIYTADKNFTGLPVAAVAINFKSGRKQPQSCQCYKVEIGGAEKQVHVKPAHAGQHRMQTSSICTSVN